MHDAVSAARALVMATYDEVPAGRARHVVLIARELPEGLHVYVAGRQHQVGLTVTAEECTDGEALKRRVLRVIDGIADLAERPCS